jgi:hypothetical protein
VVEVPDASGALSATIFSFYVSKAEMFQYTYAHDPGFGK